MPRYQHGAESRCTGSLQVGQAVFDEHGTTCIATPGEALTRKHVTQHRYGRFGSQHTMYARALDGVLRAKLAVQRQLAHDPARIKIGSVGKQDLAPEQARKE